MIKQILITGIAVAGFLVAAQVSAHNTGNVRVWNNGSNGHGHSHQTKRAPKFKINREQRQQRRMIRQGIKKCLITPAEAKRLNKQQKRINRAERRMRGDGLQRWERNRLQQRLHNARAQINRLTKNRKQCGRHQHRNNNRHNNTSWNFSNRNGSFSFNLGH